MAKGNPFSFLTGELPQRSPLVSCRRFAAALKKIHAASRLAIDGFAGRETPSGAAFAPVKPEFHPFQVRPGGDGLHFVVTPGIVVVPGTAEVFILGEAVAAPSDGFIVVKCALRHVVERIPDADDWEPAVFTGEPKLDPTRTPELAFATGPTSNYSTPNFHTGGNTWTEVTLPLAAVFPASGRVEQFVRSSLSISPAFAHFNPDPWAPDIDWREV